MEKNIKEDLRIVEDVLNSKILHLTAEENKTLCGRILMIPTNVPLSSWGKNEDKIVEYFYCKECASIYKRL